jgi:hypothetical protein
MLQDKGYYISKFYNQWKDTDHRLQRLFYSAVVDDPKVLLPVGTPRSLVVTYNVQCVTAYCVTSLYTVIYLNFASPIENGMFLTKGKEREKINISYLHNEPGPLLYEAIECQQFVTSTSTGREFCFIFFFW